MSNFNAIEFKDEIFKHIRVIENKLQNKIDANQSIILSDFKSFSANINDIINKNKYIFEVITSNKNQIDKISDIETFKNKADSMLITHEIRINNSLNDIEKMKTKYDKLFTDNIFIPGYVGQSSQFHNLSEYNLYNINEMTKLKIEKEKLKNGLKDCKNKLEILSKEMLVINESTLTHCNIYIDSIKKEIEKMIEFKIREISEKIFEFYTMITGNANKSKEEFNNIHNEIQNSLKMKDFLINMINSNFSDQNNIIDNINKKVVNNSQNININKKNINNCDNQITDMNKFIKEINFSINSINRFITKVKKNDVVYNYLTSRNARKRNKCIDAINEETKPIIAKLKYNLNSDDEEKNDKITRNKKVIDGKIIENCRKFTKSSDYSDGEINDVKFGTTLNIKKNNDNYQIKKNFEKIFGFSDNLTGDNNLTENLKDNNILNNMKKELNADIVKMKNFYELKILDQKILSDKILKKKYRRDSPKTCIKHNLMDMKLLSGTNDKKKFIDLYNFTSSSQNNNFFMPSNINFRLKNSSSVPPTKKNSKVNFKESKLKQSGRRFSNTQNNKINLNYTNYFPDRNKFIKLGLSDENSINPTTNNGAYVLANKKIENGNIIKLDNKISLLNLYNTDTLTEGEKKLKKNITNSLKKTLSGFKKKNVNNQKCVDKRDNKYNCKTEYH